jgi:hypothetical protein
MEALLIDRAKVGGDAELLRTTAWTVFGHTPLTLLCASRCLVGAASGVWFVTL